MDRCEGCGCAAALHFQDGCHRAYGFICKCPVTGEELVADD